MGHAREQAALALVLAVALALRFWGLGEHGWGAEYYSASVFSQTQSWRNFLYLAFDPAGFISVDKPPLALWLQVASVKILGFTPLALLLPQALLGAAATVLLHRLGRRSFGPSVGLLAAFLFAVTPVWVAVNRTNNTDTLLLVILLAAAALVLRAAEGASRKHWLGSMAMLGVAFNVKMLAGVLLLPVFALTYGFFGASPMSWRRRMIDFALGALALLSCALPWVLLVEFTPSDERPFVGSSQSNSALELALGHNALSRLRLQRAHPPPERGARLENEAEAPVAKETAAEQLRARMLARELVRSPPRPWRLLEGKLAAQTAWLLPLAVLALVLLGRRRREIAPPQRTALVFWGGWLLTYCAIYSALGGIMHYYYLSTLAPAMGMLAAIGLAELWRKEESMAGRRGLPALVFALAAGWQLWVEYSAVEPEFRGATPGAGSLGTWHFTVLIAFLAVLLMLLPWRSRPSHRWTRAGMISGLVVLLMLPGAWTLSGMLGRSSGLLPSADLQRLAMRSDELARRLSARREAQQANRERLIAYLRSEHHGQRFLLATTTSELAAPIIIATGEPVLARGGFGGLDPALSVERLAEMVAHDELRFALTGDANAVARSLGADRADAAVAEWIRRHGKPVDPALWSAARPDRRLELYDLKP